MKQYKKLNDAAKYQPELARGSVEVWYMKPDKHRDLGMGWSWIKDKPDLIPDPDNLSATHILLGKVKSKDRDEVSKALQGGNWSPEGEAKSLLRSKGIKHTSMSVGDVLKVGRAAYMVDRGGFKRLPRGAGESMDEGGSEWTVEHLDEDDVAWDAVTWYLSESEADSLASLLSDLGFVELGEHVPYEKDEDGNVAVEVPVEAVALLRDVSEGRLEEFDPSALSLDPSMLGLDPASIKPAISYAQNVAGQVQAKAGEMTPWVASMATSAAATTGGWALKGIHKVSQGLIALGRKVRQWAGKKMADRKVHKERKALMRKLQGEAPYIVQQVERVLPQALRERGIVDPMSREADKVLTKMIKRESRLEPQEVALAVAAMKLRLLGYGWKGKRHKDVQRARGVREADDSDYGSAEHGERVSRVMEALDVGADEAEYLLEHYTMDEVGLTLAEAGVDLDEAGLTLDEAEKSLGKVAVDSGRIIIADPAHLDNDNLDKLSVTLSGFGGDGTFAVRGVYEGDNLTSVVIDLNRDESA